MTEDLNEKLKRLEAYLPPHLSSIITPDVEHAKLLQISNHLHAVRATLSSYLPNYLVQAISQNPQPGNVKGSFHYGALLFADVSGFTAMSETLSVLGKEGAEEVTGIVNKYFTTMLEINENFGGDLLKFGGDALLIFFEGQAGTCKSLATANAMMQAMKAFTQVKTSQGVFPLRMKIGMACGPVFLASLGTPQNMDHAVMGSTLFMMSQAENYASAGEIVVHRSMLEVTRDIARYLPLADGFWRLDELHDEEKWFEGIQDFQTAAQDFGDDQGNSFDDLIREADLIGGMRPFVPGELFERIINDPQRIAVYGSHRPVTITFTNVLGIDAIIDALGSDHETLITSIANNYFVTMSEVINRFGGTVNRLDAYSVGYRILGLFGALKAHDDDPVRAVQAALEMKNSLSEVNKAAREILSSVTEMAKPMDVLPLKQRSGINSGFVFGGNTGSKARREYTVMGDQVNLTARLMGIAQEGEVLISQSIARRTSEAFHLEEKEAVKVKGKTEQVRNYSVTGIKEQSHWKTRLASRSILGRDRELSLGREAIAQTISGQGRLVVISGDSGLGKTHLAEELAWYGTQQGMDLLIGTCLSYGSTMTYHPWAEVLRELFGIAVDEPNQDPSSRLEAVRRGMEVIDEASWTPVIGTVLGLEIPDNEMTRDLDPKLRRQRVLDLTVKLLKFKAQLRPVMLVIEDAHWADPASMEMINYVARNIHESPILFMLPHRPDSGLPEWTAIPNAVDLELDVLPEEICEQMIHELLGGLSLPKSMYELIISRSGGNPFFLGEVVRALIDAGALQRDAAGNFRVVHDMSRVELPDTIYGIIISRIDRLLASDRRVLQVASVIGRVFAYRTLEGVYPYQDLAAVLRDRLNYLNDLGLTEIQVIETELYRFIHLTTRDVVYEGLPFEHRRSLHREIGAYIEEISGQTVSEQTNLLAYHYYEGQAWDQALLFNLTAARNAQREYANDTAILSAKRVLEAAEHLGSEIDTHEERVAAHIILGEVMTLIGQYHDALQHYSMARGWVEKEDTSDQRHAQLAELSRKTAEVYERQSEYETAFDWLDKGLQYLDESEPTIEAARIYLLGTGIYRRLGQNDEAANWCQKSLELAAQLKTYEGQQAVGQGYYNMGGIENRRGDLHSAVNYCLQSLDVYQQIEDVAGQARAFTNLGATYSALGEWRQAVDAYNSSLAINQRIGDIQREGFLANNLANVYLNRGEWDQASGLFTQSNEIWKRIGSPLPDAVTLSNLAQVHIYQEHWDQARECLTESQVIFEKIGSDDYIPELERRWGELHLKTGDIDHALVHVQRSIEMATDQDAKLELGMSLRVFGEIQLALGKFDEAGKSFSDSLEFLTETESDHEAARTMLSLAHLAIKKGEDINRDQLHQAIQTFERLEAQFDLTQARQLEENL